MLEVGRFLVIVGTVCVVLSGFGIVASIVDRKYR